MKISNDLRPVCEFVCMYKNEKISGLNWWSLAVTVLP